MINEEVTEFLSHSTTFELMVECFPDGSAKDSARTLLGFVASIRSKVCEPDYREDYLHWFGQVRECLSGRDCDDATVKKFCAVVQDHEIPHQFVFDFIKGIESESTFSSFRDFAALETCAYANSSAILVCLAFVLGESKPDQSQREALIELGLADYLLHKMSDFLPQLESKIFYLAFQEVQDRGLDLLDQTEPVDDDLWKDLIQFQCRRILDKLQAVKILSQLQDGRLKRALNRLLTHNLTLLKKIRRIPSMNLREKVEVNWFDRLRTRISSWKAFQIPTN